MESKTDDDATSACLVEDGAAGPLDWA